MELSHPDVAQSDEKSPNSAEPSSQPVLFTAPIADREKAFGLDEIFYSRTNKRGLISAGNDVFFRVSGYPAEKIIGTSHKIMRHPDMPEAAIQLMGDTLKEGGPCAVYMKYRDAEGAFYWVLAFITPTDEGNLSVRIKPGSDYFNLVTKQYANLLADEQDGGIDAKKSAELFEERLLGEGYANYQTFSAQAAAAEIMARDKALGLPPDAEIAGTAATLGYVKNIASACESLFNESRNVEALPMNLQVRSKRLGASAGPIGVIASDCSERIKELRNQMIDFVDACAQMVDKVCKVTLLMCVARVQAEVSERIENQVKTGATDLGENEVKWLRKQSQIYSQSTLSGTDDMLAMKVQIDRFSSAIRVLEKTIVGLNVNRIMCGIESVILGDDAGAITDIVKDLDQFQNKVPGYCQDIDRNLRALKDGMNHTPRMAQSA